MSTVTINGKTRSVRAALRSEVKVVIHPPSPPEDRAIGVARPARSNGAATAALTAAASAAPVATLAPAGSTGTFPTGLRTAGRHAPGVALSGDEFQRALQREMRRADRSKAPLSLVLYDVAEGARPPDALACRLLDAISANKRETDVIGFTGPRGLALLFPDTADAGARRFVGKMAALGFEQGISATVATYPNCLFDELASSATQPPRPAGAFTAASVALPSNDSVTPDGGDYFLKRTLDIVGALLALVLVAPLLLATAAAIAATSPGPIIFKQKRLGKGGRPFVFYKFRSMHCGSDDSIHRQYTANLIKGETAPAAGPAQPGATIYKIDADPRISRVGRVIRRTSIDELPQLFNVLRGDMSLVGPRPALPYEAEHYQSWHLRRIWAIRPGITGLWQVEGRSRVPFDEMVRMDLRYISHCSLGLDLRLLLRTVKVVLRCDGAV